MAFNTQNTKSFIHAEQYGKKKKKILKKVKKALFTGLSPVIKTKFKKMKPIKLTRRIK
jgi:hypothetical protein